MILWTKFQAHLLLAFRGGFGRIRAVVELPVQLATVQVHYELPKLTGCPKENSRNFREKQY